MPLIDCKTSSCLIFSKKAFVFRELVIRLDYIFLLRPHSAAAYYAAAGLKGCVAYSLWGSL